ncbi:hypothetical protein [Moraxella lacunata]|uniref:hypothetical protein n=1 Tax=Moraxella lacunata TaxID=477 RepID=UPI003EE0D801
MVFYVIRARLPFMFVMKNACLKKQGNRPFFKEKTQVDSHSIKQVFDDEKQSDHLNWVNF